MLSKRELATIVAMVLGTIVFTLTIAWIGAFYESRTFNRLTGAHTTAWDAMWVELRVQDGVQRDG